MYIKKNHFYIIIVVLVVLMAIFIVYSINKDNNSKDENEDLIKLVEEFGGRIKNVSLLAPRNLVIDAIQENYSPYVTEDLLQEWLNHPRRAPGKTTSSPWPDRIEIREVTRLSDNEYAVKGRIVEVTSTEAQGGGGAAYRPIELILRRSGNKWLIYQIKVYDYE